MIAQIRAELLKIRSTRTTTGLILAMIALILLFTLLTGLLTHPSGLTSKEDQRQLLSLSSLTAVFSALAGVLLVTSEYRFGTIRPTILFNPARSHVLAAKAVAGALGRNRIRGSRRGSRLGDRVRDPRRAWHYRRARQRRHSAAHARRARRRGPVGRDRRRPRRDHPQPSRRRHRAARVGPRRRQPSVRPRPFGGAVHANPRFGRTDGPASPSPGLARRRRDHLDRLGLRSGGSRYRPDRSAGPQLTPWVTGMGSRLRRTSDQRARHVVPPFTRMFCAGAHPAASLAEEGHHRRDLIRVAEPTERAHRLQADQELLAGAGPERSVGPPCRKPRVPD